MKETFGQALVRGLETRAQQTPPRSATKVEKGDIETVVGEFRKFLETALDGNARAESTILEIR